MDDAYVLRKLAELMNWDDDKAQEEFACLRLISRFKYDGYQEFVPGVRFVERLLDWLQQFLPEDRPAAYAFVRARLVYISAAEINHLVALVYPEVVQPRLAAFVARQLSIPPYLVWASPAAVEEYRRLLRRFMFIELSDGARLDVFRRANPGVIHNEQVLTAARVSADKWEEALDDLRAESGQKDLRFAGAFLIDDFTASGTSLLRHVDAKWKGKLVQFNNEVNGELYFDDGAYFHVHHFIGTAHARDEADRRSKAIRAELGDKWLGDVDFSFGIVLPTSLQVTGDFSDLADRYFDVILDERARKHIVQSGITSMRFGYGECRLPLVLDHNTPNNTFPLIWAETPDGEQKRGMRPLFPRRQRHG